MTNQITTKKMGFVDLLEELFGLLSSREKDVLKRRHSLNKGVDRKETLENIGQDYKVTRERVRQIERDSVKKIKDKLDETEIVDQLAEIEQIIKKFLKKYGGAMEEEHLLNTLIDFYGISAGEEMEENIAQHKRSLAFIISQLLVDKFEVIDSLDNYHVTWKLREAPWELVEDVIDKLVELIDSHGKPVKADEFFKKLKDQEFYQDFKGRLSNLSELEEDLLDLDEVITSYLRTSKKIKQNLFGHIGLSDWNTITPKRMNDKIYLVMKEAGKPLHFREIADLINQANFDHKKALPATIHNELILDDRYVLIGRGIYALKEWGYHSGAVTDVITSILKQKGPLNKDEIIEEVSKQRLVKKATINLALMNKEKFERSADKKYTLVED